MDYPDDELDKRTALAFSNATLSTAPPRGVPRAFTVSCMDLRFVDEAHLLFETRYSRDCYDNYVVPGPGLALAPRADVDGDYSSLHDETFFAAFKKAWAFARKLHGATTIAITDHDGCGYYGVHMRGYQRMTPAERRVAHEAQLRSTVRSLVAHLRVAPPLDSYQEGTVIDCVGVRVEAFLLVPDGDRCTAVRVDGASLTI